MAKYINPFTDFGFKKLFGEESSKDILISFLNALLKPESPIKKIVFKNPFKLGKTKYDRSLIFDLYCENENGEKFFVEMQKAEQKYFKDRMIFYSTFPVQEQALIGQWSYELKAVYCIGILDFELTDIKNKNYLNEMQIKNRDNEIFYDKYFLVTIEMPKFKKEEKELKTLLDKWLFFLKNIEGFEKLPVLFKEKIFKTATKKTEVANFSKEESQEYDESLKTLRDDYSLLTTAENKGEAKGKIKGNAEGRIEGKAEGRIEGKIEGKIEGRIEGEEIGIIKGKIEGEEIGIIKGEEIGFEKTLQIFELIKQGKTDEEIIKKLKCSITRIQTIRKSVK